MIESYWLIVTAFFTFTLTLYVIGIVAGGVREDLERKISCLETENKLLAEANQSKYDDGFRDGNLSAIKTIGKSLINDHQKIKMEVENDKQYANRL